MTKHLFVAIIIATLSAFSSAYADESIQSRRIALRDSILGTVTGATVGEHTVSIPDFVAKGDVVSDCCN
ncbi:MAG: glycoside hydrolase family 28 protein, partial [Muribaculum sp.]|nr:glycoside hydrolase family 28 protein [Muribaculum sp.]